MGSRLFGNAASLLGGRDFTNSEHRSDVATILGVGESTIPTTPSWAYDQIIDGIESGDIRGLWVIATNTSHSWIDQKRFQRLVGKLDFLVVQDLFSTTETAQYADLILPAAGWGEKEGTFINSERRFGLIKKVRRAPGEALSDFAIFRLVAASWGCDGLFREWSTPEAAFQILKRLSAGRPCDINGIRDYQHLDESGGIQWPCPILGLDSPPAAVTTDSPWNQRRLFADGNFFTRDGKANFYFEEPRPPEEIPCPAYPFTLLTGRGTSSQWHTNSRTQKSDVLRKLYPQECYVEIHPDDAQRLGVANHGQVRIKSRRGELLAGAFLTATVQPGQLFVPMHYYGVNALTHPSFDPHSRQPSYKMCAVMLELA